MARGGRVAYHGRHGELPCEQPPDGAKDWAVDVAVMLAAFLFGCGQLMLTASSIVIPDLELRQYLGIVNVVPDTSVFVALALTTLPLPLMATAKIE